MLISDEYRTLNSSLHAGGSYGRKGDKWTAKVSELIDCFEPTTILDYGCGQGALGKALNRDISEYDPAIPEKSALPEPADMVVCTDVLEHIEPVCLDDVLDHLRDLTKSVLFAVISTRPAAKFLADGRNAHLIVEGEAFWTEHLEKRFLIDQIQDHGKEFSAVLRAKNI
ncbi:class I SAM-dependent methyltransferase [Sphingobium phenoxybenzoativorans]|uniref:class I SAM-dependent methyltransferase n=1 Tax=Sphingobium phenoxybenzoativorans TaxID=1592790 RepID=UPI0009F51104|nr:methyltransferase domain-containing protein [Sphingobium phenoxybenzoativorans]